MNSIFFTVITLLLLTAGVLLLMQEFNKTKVSKDTSEPPQPELMTKEEGEDHFSVLMNSVTPVWYWRVNHEYIDFLHATIKRMKMSEIMTRPDCLKHSVAVAISIQPCINIMTISKNAALTARRSLIPIWTY